ncbi:MAG: DNA-directed RNA polymerase subunit alpha [Deltaproteobacteria bacterium]|nr:DNA-directed RNA polymerase subunit alpha [Deltaproteobacteria bacterium]
MQQLQRNWRELIRPRSVDVDQESLTDRYGKFVCEPLERGFGTSLGNALRRVLLSSIRGAAITQVLFEGVQHEFTTIPNVVEDVSELILNLKSLALRLNVEGPKTVSVKFEGEREVKAGDIFKGKNIEAIDPDHHVASIGPGGVLDFELTVRAGFGYKGVEHTKDPSAPLGTIAMDAMFSPIRRVNYNITNARVGHLTDYDRLQMEVWTNGTVAPREAVAIAAKIIKEQIQVFINFDETEEQEDIQAAPVIGAPFVDGVTSVTMAENQTREVLYRLVEDLDLSVRAQNCLQAAGIRIVGELVQKTEQEMLKTRNFGRKSLKEIKDVLVDLGLSLGMQLDGFDPKR